MLILQRLERFIVCFKRVVRDSVSQIIQNIKSILCIKVDQHNLLFYRFCFVCFRRSVIYPVHLFVDKLLQLFIAHLLEVRDISSAADSSRFIRRSTISGGSGRIIYEENASSVIKSTKVNLGPAEHICAVIHGHKSPGSISNNAVRHCSIGRFRNDVLHRPFVVLFERFLISVVKLCIIILSKVRSLRDILVVFKVFR